MTGRFDLNTVIEDWREQDAMAGRDPEGERLEASAERRYRAERPCAVGPDAWFYRGITVTSADSISKRKTA